MKLVKFLVYFIRKIYNKVFLNNFFIKCVKSREDNDCCNLLRMLYIFIIGYGLGSCISGCVFFFMGGIIFYIVYRFGFDFGR